MMSKKLLSRLIVNFILFFITTAISFFLFEYFSPQYYSPAFFLSPLPAVLSAKARLSKNSGFVSSDEPVLGESTQNLFPTSSQPLFDNNIGLSARSYAAVDNKSDRLLVAHNIEKQRPIASLTKIMTAILALETAPIDYQIKIDKKSAETQETYMGIELGEIWTVKELLYGLMLPSGNDAAEALAVGIGGRRGNFINLMNKKAGMLGLKSTHFVNPSGLDEENGSVNKSTAWDLIALTRYALKNQKFRQIASTPSVYFKKNSFHRALYLENRLSFDRAYPGIKGVKPGYTDKANTCLVSLAENQGREILLVILASDYSKRDAVELYDYVYAQLGVHIPGREKEQSLWF